MSRDVHGDGARITLTLPDTPEMHAALTLAADTLDAEAEWCARYGARAYYCGTTEPSCLQVAIAARLVADEIRQYTRPAPKVARR